jgi:hypothetical protein
MWKVMPTAGQLDRAETDEDPGARVERARVPS